MGCPWHPSEKTSPRRRAAGRRGRSGGSSDDLRARGRESGLPGNEVYRYRHFPQTSDEEVRRLFESAARRQ